MGCRELTERDYYRLAGATEKPHSRPRPPAQKITRIAGFFTVISNYRYYSPELGRWLTRDPIWERGGWNLYGMANNDPVGVWDRLGLEGGFTVEQSLTSAEIQALNNFQNPAPHPKITIPQDAPKDPTPSTQTGAIAGAAQMAVNAWSAIAIFIKSSTAEEDCIVLAAETKGKHNGVCCCVMSFPYIVGPHGNAYTGQHSVYLVKSPCKTVKAEWAKSGVIRSPTRTVILQYSGRVGLTI